MKKIINNTLYVKKSNTELIRLALRDLKSSTRVNLSKITGLSLVTCGNILNEMLAQGEVFEAEMEESKGGRPSRCYQYNENFSLLISIVIIADGIKKILMYEVTNLFSEQIDKGIIEYDYIDFDTINNTIEKMLHSHDGIKAIGIGVPGVTTADGNIVTCDIPEMENMCLKTRLVEMYDTKIIVENETHAVVYGLYNQRAEKSETDYYAVLIAPVGCVPGAGIIIGDEVIRGSKRLAGEVSLIPKGTSRIQLLEEVKTDRNKLIDVIVDSIISIIVLVNPSVLVLTGSAIKEEMIPIIINKCSEQIDDMFLPAFEYETEEYMGYLVGIRMLTLRELDNNIILIQRQ